jgi:hypothetical protein
MATGFYLLDHANRLQQYGVVRRFGNKPSGTIVIHTAENIADQIGGDLGAESVARYCTTRDTYGAYHRLVDADSIVKMVPFGYETWHCVPTNPWSIGISMAVRAGDWNKYGSDYETRVLRNAARAAADAVREVKKNWGVTVPIKHISGAQARAKAPGFVAHGETDPTRRTDPGADFDWPRFLAMVREELAPTTTQEEEDDMPTAEEIAKAVWNYKARVPSNLVPYLGETNTMRAIVTASAFRSERIDQDTSRLLRELAEHDTDEV